MSNTEKLALLPFTEEEKDKDYTLTSYTERGNNINILRDTSYVGMSSGTLYKIGLKDPEDKYYWFLDGKPIKTRKKAQQIFNYIEVICRKDNLGKPFIMKKKT